MLGDLSRLDRLTPRVAADFRERVRATRYEDRVPLPAERQDVTQMPEELRIPLIEWALRRDTHPAAGLALLFQHLLPVPAVAIDRVLGKEVRGALEGSGVLRAEGEQLRSGLLMVIADGVFIWSDRASDGAEAVMTPGPTTADLINLQPPSLGGSFLDVGTGPGTLVHRPLAQASGSRSKRRTASSR